MSSSRWLAALLLLEGVLGGCAGLSKSMQDGDEDSKPSYLERPPLPPAARRVRFLIDFAELQRTDRQNARAGGQDCRSITHYSSQGQKCLPLDRLYSMGRTLAEVMRASGFTVVTTPSAGYDAKLSPYLSGTLIRDCNPRENQLRTYEETEYYLFDGAFCLRVHLDEPPGFYQREDLKYVFEGMRCEQSDGFWKFAQLLVREDLDYHRLANAFVDVLSDCPGVDAYGQQVYKLGAACVSNISAADRAQLQRDCRSQCATKVGGEVCVTQLNTCRTVMQGDEQSACDRAFETCLSGGGITLPVDCAPSCVDDAVNQRCR